MRKSSHSTAALFFWLIAFAPGPALAANQVSLDQYRAHLQSLQALVQSCSANPGLCNPKSVGNDDQVQLPGLGAGANTNFFQARYDWLRRILLSAHDPREKARASQLLSAEARLDESLHDAHRAASSRVDITAARQKADGILARREFETV